MKTCKTIAAVSLIMAISAGSIDVASARVRHHHRYASRHDNGGGALVAGTALGLLGAGIAGAAAADNGYGYDSPPYGAGYYGAGYYGPGYGYFGY